jgi:hypothetical protein
VENPIHVHDLQATILHCLGLDHERLTYRYAGRDFRLTDIHGRVVNGDPGLEELAIPWPITLDSFHDYFLFDRHDSGEVAMGRGGG